MIALLLAAGIALVASLVGTPFLISWLRAHGIGQPIREEGPETHLTKAGTPTMGGVAIVGAAVAGYIAAHLREGAVFTWGGMLTMGAIVGAGAVGLVDDYIKIRKQRSLGLRARAKFLGQMVVAVVFAVLAINFPNSSGVKPASTHLSFVRDIGVIGLGAVGFVILAYLIVAATSNAVNLTDGLDGLAAGAAAMVFGAFTLISFLQYRYTCGSSPAAGCYVVRDPLDVALVAASAMAACFGFLWWNAPPAQIFMGDTGSLALGGLMAGLAILCHVELLLGVLGGLFAMVTLSGIIQTGWFKYTRIRTGAGRRVFRMAPLHHHFELAGWEPETVMVRFWIMGGMAVAFGMGLFYADFIGNG